MRGTSTRDKETSPLPPLLQAKKLCPDLNIVQVPTLNGKADLTLYRQFGNKVWGVQPSCVRVQPPCAWDALHVHAVSARGVRPLSSVAAM